jgi:hypothetical protein
MVHEDQPTKKFVTFIMPAMAFTFYGNVCEHKQLLTHNMAIVALL